MLLSKFRIKIDITISTASSEMMRIAEQAAREGGYAIAVPPIDFTVTATFQGVTYTVNRYPTYIERLITIPEGMDPERITTAVVVEPNGRIRHVPTEVITADGKYYAKVNSLTDSTYTVIWNPISFADVEHHWAMQTVNNMGSRLVVYGTGDEKYSPDRNITRAEFTAILVRGLGLRPETGESVFSDIKVTDWYNGVVNAAYEYQLVKGFDDGTFRPNEEITREQATMMIANAMKITGLDKRSQSSASNTILSAFHDLDDVSHWAQDAVRDTVQAGIIIGRSQTELAPKQYILRSEVATMIERLLKKSGLI